MISTITIQFVRNKLLLNLFCWLAYKNCFPNSFPSVENVRHRICEEKSTLEWFPSTANFLPFTVAVHPPCGGSSTMFAQIVFQKWHHQNEQILLDSAAKHSRLLHVISCDFIWFQMISNDFKWFQMISSDFIYDFVYDFIYDFMRFHMISYDFTWLHVHKSPNASIMIQSRILQVTHGALLRSYPDENSQPNQNLKRSSKNIPCDLRYKSPNWTKRVIVMLNCHAETAQETKGKTEQLSNCQNIKHMNLTASNAQISLFIHQFLHRGISKGAIYKRLGLGWNVCKHT